MYCNLNCNLKMCKQQEHRIEDIDLRTLRRRVGLRQYQLARLLGIPQSVLRDMERGRLVMTPEWRKRITNIIDEAQRSKPTSLTVRVKLVVTPDAEQRLRRVYDLLLERGSAAKQGKARK